MAVLLLCFFNLEKHADGIGRASKRKQTAIESFARFDLEVVFG